MTKDYFLEKRNAIIELVKDESKRIINNYDGSTEPLLGYAFLECGLIINLNPYEDQDLHILDIKGDKIHKIPVPISGGKIICETTSDPDLAVNLYNESIEERASWMTQENTKKMYMDRIIVLFHIFSWLQWRPLIGSLFFLLVIRKLWCWLSSSYSLGLPSS